MGQDLAKVETLVPAEMQNESEELFDFMGGLGGGDKKTFLAFIHGCNYASALKEPIEPKEKPSGRTA